MGKSNVAEKSATAAVAVVEPRKEEVAAAAVMTVKKNAPEAEKPMTLEDKIQKVEDLTRLIDRWRTLSESRRKIQTFQIGADGMSSAVLLRDASGNEFKTSNSAVISAVIEEMKRTLDAKIREVEAQINL